MRTARSELVKGQTTLSCFLQISHDELLWNVAILHKCQLSMVVQSTPGCDF